MADPPIVSLREERRRRAEQVRLDGEEAARIAAEPPDEQVADWWPRFWRDLDKRVFECLAVAPGFSPDQRRILGEVFGKLTERKAPR
jgi:hypothetical protein